MPLRFLTYKKSLEAITTHLGTVYTPMVQSKIKPKQEPAINDLILTETGLNSTMTRTDEIRFEKLYDYYLSKKGKINSQMKKNIQ